MLLTYDWNCIIESYIFFVHFSFISYLFSFAFAAPFQGMQICYFTIASIYVRVTWFLFSSFSCFAYLVCLSASLPATRIYYLRITSASSGVTWFLFPSFSSLAFFRLSVAIFEQQKTCYFPIPCHCLTSWIKNMLFYRLHLYHQEQINLFSLYFHLLFI